MKILIIPTAKQYHHLIALDIPRSNFLIGYTRCELCTSSMTCEIILPSKYHNRKAIEFRAVFLEYPNLIIAL